TTPGYDPNAQIVCKNPACVGCGYWNKKIRFLSSGTAKCLNLATRSSSDGQLLSAVDCDDSAEDFSYDGSSKQIKFEDSSGQVRCLTYGAGASVSENLYMSSCDELTNSQWYYDKNAKALKTFSANNFCMTVDPANDEVYMSECGAIPGKGVLFIESQSDYAECPSELGLSSITSEGHCRFALSSLLDSPTLVDMNIGSWDYTPCGCFVWDSDGTYYDFEECADDYDPVASDNAKLACIKENFSSQSIVIPDLWMPEISITGMYQQVRVNYDVTLCMTIEDQNDEGTNCILNIAEAGGKCVWMTDCVGNTATVPGQTSNNQAFYFDPSTYAIRTFENYCLEYDTGTGVNNTNQQEANLYASPSCTGATNQQFFYDMPTGAIKTFYDDKCIDMDYTTGDKFYNLYLNGCNKRYNQQFIIPQVWIPDVFLDSIRLVNAQQTLCWTAQTELHSNNVNMTQDQKFEYNPQARAITIYGMCLGYVTVMVDYGVDSKTATVNNVNLQQCDGSEAQRWAYESNGQISNMKAGCIEFSNEPINGNGNLYLSEMSCGSCGMRRDQTMYIGSNCPNTKTYDKVFVDEDDCNAQCGSDNCNPSAGGLIFDSWNDGSSCGMQEGQQVWAGCDYIYVVLDDCEKECDNSCSAGATNIYFSYVSSCGMKRQQPMYTCGSDTASLYVVEDDCNADCTSDCTDTDSEVEGGLIFDSLNAEQTSCGLTQGQEVWVGCGYVYAVEGDCTTECGTDGCSTTSKLYFTSWLPASFEYQTFRIPSKWSAVDHEPLYDSARPIPTGLWNGDWNKVTDCQIDLLEGVLQTCDDSMSLLLGDMTSLGTLQEINGAIQDHELGPEKAMPGSCCLDDPSTSEWFGYYYATSVTYEGKPMECQNTGPWHLGISEEACSNAGGRWFPSPCFTLQTCINDRPANGTQGYSPSFEQFASRITITDPSNTTQCNNARQQLGYAPDYPFDVDVCRTFYEQECSTLWLSVDGLAGNWSSKGEQTTPASAGLRGSYETTFKVGYCEIDGSGDCTAQQGSRRLQDENGANRRLQGAPEPPPGWSTPGDIDSHESLAKLATALTSAQAAQAALQLTYDTIGFFQGRRGDDDKMFKAANPFTGTTGDYNSALDLKGTYKEFNFGGQKGKTIVKVDKEGNRVEGENKAYADPLEDEDKNPCIEHAYLHKSMMQGGGIEVEIFQEPDPRYVECYERQKARQERERIPKALLYTSNLVVEALSMTLGQLSLTPNDEYNDSYYTESTWTNLQKTIPWITQSLQTINTNLASGINQGTQYVSDQIGTPTATGSRSLRENGVSYPKDTLHSRLEYIEDFLEVMLNDFTDMSSAINDIGEAVGIKTQEPNRGKSAKKSKKKNKNMYEDNMWPGGQDRLLQVSLSEQIEAKIDSKIGHLENNINNKNGHLENKMDKLENKMDKLENKMDLILSLLDTTQQK
ncbi:hypothetical protein THAOC_35347, partial [Thalassiosira oceanica]